MYLETSDRRSLFHDRARRRRASSPRPRSARTPPPAFLFLPIHLSNSPRAKVCSQPFGSPKGRRSSSSENCRMACHCFSDELQRRVIAAKRGGRRRWAVYRRRPDPLSTKKIQVFAPPSVKDLFSSAIGRHSRDDRHLSADCCYFNAAQKPYSWHLFSKSNFRGNRPSGRPPFLKDQESGACPPH
jgi:hypothetical protein